MKKLVVFDLDGTLFVYPRRSATHDAPLDESTLLPNVREKLTELRANDIMIGVATNQETGEFRDHVYDFRTILDRLDCVSAFLNIPRDMICFGSPNTAYWKPAPGMLIDFARIDGVAPTDMLYVGDSKSDQQAAEAAGVDFAWAWDYFDWPNGKADRSIDWEAWEREGRSISRQ